VTIYGLSIGAEASGRIPPSAEIAFTTAGPKTERQQHHDPEWFAGIVD